MTVASRSGVIVRAWGDSCTKTLQKELLTRSLKPTMNLDLAFLEHHCMSAMEREFISRNVRYGREVRVPLIYKGEVLSFHRVDLLVEEKVVVEVKSTQDLHPSAKRQLTNYLRATDLEVGLLLHFGPEPKFYRIILSNKNKPHRKRLQSVPAANIRDERSVGAEEANHQYQNQITPETEATKASTAGGPDPSPSSCLK